MKHAALISILQSHALVATVACAVPFVLACSRAAPRQQTRVPVVLATARHAPVPYTVTTSGTVEPMQTVAVEPQVTGILTGVAFVEGQEVRAGSVLFQVDPRPYQAALAQARGQLARDEAQAANARREAARYAALASKDYVTRSQADQAAATAAAAEAAVASDRAAVARAAIDLANCTIRAPISGRTGSLMVRRGNLVRANSAPPLVVINQIRPILVRFTVPQSQLPEIQRYHGTTHALPVSATPAEGAGTPAEGTLFFVDNTVDSATGTVLLKARFENASGTLWPGQFVRVALTLYVDPDALVVPVPAVLTGQQGTYVFVVDAAGRARERIVKVARTADTLAVIRAGLAAGDRVVVDGQSRLVPGAPVVERPPARTESTSADSAAGR